VFSFDESFWHLHGNLTLVRLVVQQKDINNIKI
jgi:hypothetical protein